MSVALHPMRKYALVPEKKNVQDIHFVLFSSKIVQNEYLVHFFHQEPVHIFPWDKVQQT